MEGGNYIVSWCFGHLVELADASSYDERYAKWRYDDLPIVPESWMFEVTKDKAQQFKVLSALMKDKRVAELVCATDAGREGELIFRLVYNKAGCTKPFKRLWISSLEDSAIREGFNHLRDGKEYDRLYEAALSRSKADWIVGINGTRLFTTLYHKKLVVGRVQTPTLAMLVERDGKISTFQKEKYFNIHIGKGNLTADLEKVKTEEEAKRIAAACEKKQAVVSSLKRETKTVNPPKLYDLTTLQREANRPADARSRPDTLRKEAPDLSAHGQPVHHGRYGGHRPSGYFYRLPPASAFLRCFGYSGHCPRNRQQQGHRSPCHSPDRPA